MMNHRCAKYGKPISSKQKLRVGHEDMTETYEFDLKVKAKCRFGNMNVPDISLMLIDSCAKFDKPVSNHKIVMVCTDRRTDRVISIYPLNFIQGGYKNM